MRLALLAILLLPLALRAQDGKRLQAALRTGNVQALDRWMKHELHRQRKGRVATTPSASYTVHGPTYDSLVAFLRRQPDVRDAAWDGCVNKISIWPGHSTIGMRWQSGDRIMERCWAVQEGIPGTIKLFGWRPHVRKDREQLKYLGARECPGFVEEQRRHCADR